MRVMLGEIGTGPTDGGCRCDCSLMLRWSGGNPLGDMGVVMDGRRVLSGDMGGGIVPNEPIVDIVCTCGLVCLEVALMLALRGVTSPILIRRA